jgi:FixJ family two-component response regulator
VPTPAGHVLVADDQPDVVTALGLLLRSEGIESDAAGSVLEVLQQLNQREYDLLLMDLNYARDTTSGREGLDLLAEVQRRHRGLPVIIMTGWGSVDTAVEAMRRGARTFVAKPWDNATPAATILKEIEDGRTARRAAHLARLEQRDARIIQRFVSWLFALYDAGTRTLTYTNAGHPPPVMARLDGSLIRLNASGIVAGVFEHASYEQQEIVFDRDDRLLLFTDGITEAVNGDGLEFGDDRLDQTLLRHRRGSPDELVRGIFTEVESFTGACSRTMRPSWPRHLDRYAAPNDNPVTRCARPHSGMKPVLGDAGI